MVACISPLLRQAHVEAIKATRHAANLESEMQAMWPCVEAADKAYDAAAHKYHEAAAAQRRASADVELQLIEVHPHLMCMELQLTFLPSCIPTCPPSLPIPPHPIFQLKEQTQADAGDDASVGSRSLQGGTAGQHSKRGRKHQELAISTLLAAERADLEVP